MDKFEFSLELVETLIDLAKKKDVACLNISVKDFKISIDLKQPVLSVAAQPVTETKSVVLDGFVDEKTNKTEELKIKGKVVKSPVVGTFYDRPSPDKPPFVKIGDRVKVGDVLFIIEAMKFMNEVKSQFDGVVSNVLVDSGDGVEFGEAIMILE